jgi:hypothetical protein
MSYAGTLQNSCICRQVSMPSTYHVGQSVSSLACVFEFLKFSVLKRKCIKLIWSKQKLICEEWIYLDAYKCIIMQFVSVFITAHLYTLSSLFILLHSVLRLFNCIRYVLWNYDKVYTPAPTIWTLWTDFTTFFLLRGQPSPFLWKLASYWK